VGKALHDGQLIDAYFTRTFYKHMLGQVRVEIASAHHLPEHVICQFIM
jgi:hypothetical protein